MTATLMARGVCNCGRLFLIFQPEAADMAERLKAALKDSDTDVFICDEPEAFCSKCGQAISLPIPEQLDRERSPLRDLLDHVEGLENGTVKPEPGQSSDELF